MRYVALKTARCVQAMMRSRVSTSATPVPDAAGEVMACSSPDATEDAGSEAPTNNRAPLPVCVCVYVVQHTGDVRKDAPAGMGCFCDCCKTLWAQSPEPASHRSSMDQWPNAKGKTTTDADICNVDFLFSRTNLKIYHCVCLFSAPHQPRHTCWRGGGKWMCVCAWCLVRHSSSPHSTSSNSSPPSTFQASPPHPSDNFYIMADGTQNCKVGDENTDHKSKSIAPMITRNDS